MIEFLLNYGLFALKLVTVVAALAALAAFIFAMVTQHDAPSEGRLEISKLNDRRDSDAEVMRQTLLSDSEFRAHDKQRKAEKKAKEKQEKKASRKGSGNESAQRPRVFVLNFHGDLQASAVGSLRREISALLTLAEQGDEVVVRLESGGGLVHSYGLGASQLKRIVDRKLKLTVCVDKVAASGGYMMACVANQVLAAPFSVIGSIGVVAQLPNFHRLLKKHDVDIELITAGKDKRTLTVFGENTDEARKKFIEEIEETHGLFKQFVQAARPQVDIEEVSSGKVWFGTLAMQEKLIDGITTSDEYLDAACARADVFEIKFEPKKSLQDRLAQSLEASFDRVLLRWWGRGIQVAPSLSERET